jgi:hypothetical protein
MNQRIFTPEQEELLKQLYPTTINSKLTKMFNCCESCIRSKAKKLGLQKDYSVIYAGNKPPVRPKNNYNRMEEGTIVERNGQTLVKYNSKWVSLRKRNWLEAGNTIPEGYVVAAKNGNLNDHSVENTEVITRDDMKRRATAIRWSSSDYLQRKQNESLERQQAKERREQQRKEKELKARERKKQQQRNRRVSRFGVKVRKVKKEAVKQIKPVQQVKVRELPKPIPRKQERVYKTRVQDFSKQIPIRINSKTWTYAKPGQDIEQVKQNFLNIYKLSA